MKNVAKRRILVTRFPYESQLGGEEMHTIRLMEGLVGSGKFGSAKRGRSGGAKRGGANEFEAFFLGSCSVLERLFKDAGFETQRAWLGKPPVSKLWLVIFTVMFPILFVMAGWHLWRARRRWQVDVLYCLSFGEKLLMTPWARLFGMKVLWLEHARVGRWLARNPWRHVYKLWSRWATVVVTSNAMLPLIERFVSGTRGARGAKRDEARNAKNLVAISCGVIVEKPAPLPKEILDFLGGVDRPFLIGCVSRLTVDKGVDMVVRLVQSKPDTKLILVGEGPLRAKLEAMSAQARAEGRILILPSMPRRQLMALYEAVDLFVLASTEMDPFGMVAAEAMWFGAPVLVTDKCGISEDLHSGREALIVPAKISAMDKAVKKLMKHDALRKKVAKQGQAFVKKHYQLERMVGEFERVIG